MKYHLVSTADSLFWLVNFEMIWEGGNFEFISDHKWFDLCSTNFTFIWQMRTIFGIVEFDPQQSCVIDIANTPAPVSVY